MAVIRPCADLRNKYNEISKICHQTQKPIYITKNGTNDLVVLSDEAYEEIVKSTQEKVEEKIEKLISKQFDKHYNDFEQFKKDIFRKIEQSIKEIENGNCIPMENIIAEMEEFYDSNK